MEPSLLIGGLSARLYRVSDDPHCHAAGLLQALAQVPDPRDPRGRVHSLPSLLAVAVSAVAAGQRSVSAIGEWAADLPVSALDRLRVARDRFSSLDSSRRFGQGAELGIGGFTVTSHPAT